MKFLDTVDTGIWRLAEIAIMAICLGYGAYSNASKVPYLQESMIELKTDMAVIKSQVNDIRESLMTRRRGRPDNG